MSNVVHGHVEFAIVIYLITFGMIVSRQKNLYHRKAQEVMQQKVLQ